MVEVQLAKGRRRIDVLMVTVVGILSCSNIVSAFIVGSTSIAWLNVLSVIFLFVCILRNKGKIINLLHYITKDFWLTGFAILLSITQVLLFNPSNAYQWLVGCISILLNFSIIVFVIEEKNYKEFLYIGIAIGLIINFLLALYTMFLYNNGIIFDLASFFPNTSGIGQMYLSNAYRARGLFKEQGHMMRYLAIVSLPTLNYLKNKNRIAYIILLGIVGFLAAFSGSSSLAIFAIGVTAYFFLKEGKNGFRIIGIITAIIVAIVLVIHLGRNLSFFSRLSAAFQVGVLSIFDTQGANSDRIRGMQYAISIIKEYPIVGCGWNSLTKIFMDHGYFGSGIFGSYSGGLSLIAELGIASLFYFYFVISKSFSLLRYHDNDECLAVGISLMMYFLLFLTTDYVLDPGSATFLAIVFIVFVDMRDRQRRENE